MTSIVVLTYNQLEDCTKPCIESIYKYTGINEFELIVVDNNSHDGTPEYLKSIEPNHQNMTIILNDINKGYSAGNNDGINASKGEFVILLNNDTLVSEGWLEKIMKPFTKDQSIGMVGPISNSVGNEQKVNINDLNEKNYNKKILKYISENKDVITYTKRLGFFCVAIKKELIDKVGLLDEKFGIGMFEDDDYCVRAIKENYKLAVTDGCFIYHKGSVSFKKLSTDTYHDIFVKNKGYFLEKHGVDWSYSDLLLGYFNYFTQVSNSENISCRQEDFKNLILFLKEIERKSEPATIDKTHKELMKISDWATSLNEQLKMRNEELGFIKSNFWFRVLRKIGLIKLKELNFLEKHLALIKESQLLIKNNTVNANLDIYQSQELFYWEHIPLWIKDKLMDSKNMKILDIGCGYGTLGIYCRLLSPHSKIKTIDVVTFANVDFLRSMNIDYSIQNIETEPLEGKYDLIILSEVLEHFNFHPVATLRKIREHLNLNGTLILTTPDAKSWGKVDKYYASLNKIPDISTFCKKSDFNWIDDHVWQYSQSELFKIIELGGFSIVKGECSQGIGGKKHFNLLLKVNKGIVQ